MVCMYRFALDLVGMSTSGETITLCPHDYHFVVDAESVQIEAEPQRFFQHRECAADGTGTTENYAHQKTWRKTTLT